MKKKWIAALLAVAMVFSIIPGGLFVQAASAADEAVAPADVYVSAGGDDTAAGTKEAPYATLKQAVDVAPDGATIYVMDNIEMKECARFYNKHLTITSEDAEAPVTVSRGDEFETIADNARSWYNPALIEVQGNKDTAGLTLINIILDDQGKHEGTIFAQAISKSTDSEAPEAKATEEAKQDKGNCQYVQDAMIASNAVVPCTITLGQGAVLRNYGGMSAVRVTDKATLVMEAGSVIEDKKASEDAPEVTHGKYPKEKMNMALLVPFGYKTVQ